MQGSPTETPESRQGAWKSRRLEFSWAASYRDTSQFAGNLATCVESGVDMTHAVQVAGRALRGQQRRAALDQAWRDLRGGSSLGEALAHLDVWLPSFFVPVVRAGEDTGKLAEALRFIESHCRMLEGPTRAAQRAWMLPLGMMVLASLTKIALYFLYTTSAAFLSVAGSAFWTYLSIVALVLVCRSRPVRPWIDRLRLQLPWFGIQQRDMAVHRFFEVMDLAYSVSDQRFERMVELAGRSVPNVAARHDLLLIASKIRAGETISDAFRTPTILSVAEKDIIAVGETAGKLDDAFQRVSKAAGESLQARLKIQERFLTRAVAYFVVLSLVMTLLLI